MSYEGPVEVGSDEAEVPDAGAVAT
jgi:hypothetical protein